jgi:Tfp pilus assembly protein PilF
MGNKSEAETDLTKAADSHDSSVASLAKVALANLYAQTGRNSQAVEEFRNLIAHPTTTVPKPAAQLLLADLYSSNGQQEEARRIYAEIKDQDKDTQAAQIATQKLQGK